MYDFAHPIEDAVEHITHSICTLEFEDHRPLYDWVVRECEFENPPRQIEFAKLYLTNVVTGKRYIKKLVEDGIVDGWDDPRLVSIAALRRRGYTPESIKRFVELVGVSKANSSVDYAMLVAKDSETGTDSFDKYVIYSLLSDAVICYKNGSFEQIDIER